MNGMNKRRNYFIDKKFQSGFIIKFCLLVAAASVLTMVITYFMTKKATTVSFVNSRVVVQGTADFLFPILIQTVIVATILVSLATMFIALFISHRIVGPAFRFKRVLNMLSSGNFSGECRIRKTDALQDVAVAINNMMTSISRALHDTDARIRALKEAIKNMPEQDGGNNLKKLVSDLEKAFHYFRY